MSTATTSLLKSRLLKLHEELSDRARYTHVPEGATFGGSSAEGDHTPVPRELIQRIHKIAERVGYPVTMGDPGPDSLGVTNHMMQDITLRRTMSPASVARVSCHELSHAFDGFRPPWHFHEQGELCAESTAALVTHALGVTDGRFSEDFLHSYSRGEPFPQYGLTAVRDTAVDYAARILTEVGAAA